VYVQGAAKGVNGCQFTGNSAESSSNTVFGGALAVLSGASVSASIFADNTANGPAGGIAVLVS